MFDKIGVGRLADCALQESSKLLLSACNNFPVSQQLIDECIQEPYPPVIGDAIMRNLDDQGAINDNTMMMFDSVHLQLSSVHITPDYKNFLMSPNISFSGLNVLKTQNLRKILFSGRRIFDRSSGTLMSTEDRGILRVLNDWTIHNLISLELPFNELNNNIILRISGFKNLRHLNVACASHSFSSSSLETCVAGMPFLESLDVSETQVVDISSLMSRKKTLKYLSLYATQALFSPATPSVLYSLSGLKFLDISLPADLPYAEDLSQFKLTPFLARLSYYCPNLEQLDISGNQRLSLDKGRSTVLSCLSSLPKLSFVGAAIDGDLCHWLKGLFLCFYMIF